MTKDEFDTTVKAVCPHCARGTTLRQRPDTKEWQHILGQGRVSITICFATYLRNSELAEKP